MNILTGLIINILEEGLIYGIMAMGVYITYSVLSFPDLSVDGTFPLGCCVTAALACRGVHPLLCLLAAFACGCAAGALTGVLHVRLHITDLLSGILVMTALYSVNLAVLGGKAVLPFYNKPTIFNSGLVKLLPGALYSRRVLIVLILLVLALKLLLDQFFRTKKGLLLRATGSNAQFVTSLAVHSGRMKILGLMLGNGLTALSGAVLAQQAESASVASGTGMLVMALASVILGSALFKRVRFLRPTTVVLLGSIVYKACLVAAMQLGLPTNYLKLLMSVLFVAALVVGNRMEKGRRQSHG